MNQAKVKRKIGKYEVGRTIGEGSFAKVKFARNSQTGEAVAIKILDKDAVLKHKMAEQVYFLSYTFVNRVVPPCVSDSPCSCASVGVTIHGEIIFTFLLWITLTHVVLNFGRLSGRLQQ